MLSLKLLSESEFLALSDDERRFYFEKLSDRILEIAYIPRPKELKHYVEHNPVLDLVPLEEKLTALKQIKYGATVTDEMLIAIGALYKGIPVPRSTSEMHGKKIIEILKAFKAAHNEGRLDFELVRERMEGNPSEEGDQAINLITEIIAKAYNLKKTPLVTLKAKILDSLGRDDTVGGNYYSDGTIDLRAEESDSPLVTGITRVRLLFHEIIHHMQNEWCSGDCPEAWVESKTLRFLQQDEFSTWNFDFLEEQGLSKKQASEVYRHKPDEKEAYMAMYRFGEAFETFLYHLEPKTTREKKGFTTIMLPKDKLLLFATNSSEDPLSYWLEKSREYTDYNYCLHDRRRMIEAFPQTYRPLKFDSSGASYTYHIKELDIEAMFPDQSEIPVLVPAKRKAYFKKLVEGYEAKPEREQLRFWTPKPRDRSEEMHMNAFLSFGNVTGKRLKLEAAADIPRSWAMEIFGDTCLEARFDQFGNPTETVFRSRDGFVQRTRHYINPDYADPNKGRIR